MNKYMINLNNFTGVVFLTASILRILCKECRKNELKYLGLQKLNPLDSIVAYSIIIFELLIGIYLINPNLDVNSEYYRLIIKSLVYVLPVTMIMILYNNFDKVINSFWDICTYQPTTMSIVLHLTYFIIAYNLDKNNI